MEAGDNHNPILLQFEENPVRKAPDSRAAAIPIGDWKLKWMLPDCLNRGFDRQAKRSPSSGRMLSYQGPRIEQVLIRLWCPDDGDSQDFLNRPALTCCHEITSEGFCSCRPMRKSSSARCVSVSDAESASRLSQTVSRSSAFSAADRVSIWLRRSLMIPNASADSPLWQSSLGTQRTATTIRDTKAQRKAQLLHSLKHLNLDNNPLRS